MSINSLVFPITVIFLLELLLSHDEVEAEQKASMEKSREIDFFKSELEAAKIDVEKMSLQNAEIRV